MHLIVGASGTVGTRVARRLLERGDAVRAVSRDIRRLEGLRRLGAVPIAGDLRSAAWMPGALEGVHGLILASHGLAPPSRDNHPGLIDDEGNRRIIDAARQAGVQRVVLLSVARIAGRPTLFEAVKRRAEEHLKGSGLPYAIVRPTVFIETHALLLLGEPLVAKGAVQFFGPGTATLNWISADDVADHVVRMLDVEPCERIDVIGGKDNLSRCEVLATIERVLGKRARRTHVPLPVLRVMRATVGPLHPGMRFLLDMALAEAAANGTTSPAPLDWTGPASVEDVIRRWAASR